MRSTLITNHFFPFLLISSHILETEIGHICNLYCTTSRIKFWCGWAGKPFGKHTTCGIRKQCVVRRASRDGWVKIHFGEGHWPRTTTAPKSTHITKITQFSRIAECIGPAPHDDINKNRTWLECEENWTHLAGIWKWRNQCSLGNCFYRTEMENWPRNWNLTHFCESHFSHSSMR